MTARRDYRLLWIAAAALVSIVLFAALDARLQLNPRLDRDVKHGDRIGTACSAVLYLMTAVICGSLIRTRQRSRGRTVVLFLIIALFAMTTLNAGWACLATSVGFNARWSRDPANAVLWFMVGAVNAAAAVYAVRFTLPAKASRGTAGPAA